MAVVKPRESIEFPTGAPVAGEPPGLSGDAATAQPPEAESEVVANSIGSLLQRVAGSSVREIDQLIGELQTIRSLLEGEGARVQREIIEYAHLSQSAMQTTKVIAETLGRCKAPADAPEPGGDDKVPRADPVTPRPDPVTQEHCRAITGLRPDGSAVLPIRQDEESASRAKRFVTR
jgi:hypothetical protein